MNFLADLYLKIPQGKPPFIGILYKENEESATKNQDLVGARQIIDLYLHINASSITIYLIQEGSYAIRAYKHIQFNTNALWQWVNGAVNADKINFGHLRKKRGQVVIENTQKKGKYFYFPIRKVYIINDDSNKVIRILS